jgi:ubiquinone/menaquinone biosynthesis C-methylase UbiE
LKCPVGFPWETLSAGSKIVDVGGGIGAHTLPVAKKFPSFKYIIQDLVVDQTEEVRFIHCFENLF